MLFILQATWQETRRNSGQSEESKRDWGSQDFSRWLDITNRALRAACSPVFRTIINISIYQSIIFRCAVLLRHARGLAPPSTHYAMRALPFDMSLAAAMN